MTVSPGLRLTKRQRTRETIQREALRLSGELGYAATTVAEIAAAAEQVTPTAPLTTPASRYKP